MIFTSSSLVAVDFGQHYDIVIVKFCNNNAQIIDRRPQTKDTFSINSKMITVKDFNEKTELLPYGCFVIREINLKDYNMSNLPNDALYFTLQFNGKDIPGLTNINYVLTEANHASTWFIIQGIQTFEMKVQISLKYLVEDKKGIYIINIDQIEVY